MSENTKYYCDRCNKEINNSFIYISEIDHKYLCNDCFKKEQPKELAKQIDQLKQQLAEKDKEIEEKMMSFEKRCQEYYKSDEFKRDFAIQELEKVKELLLDEYKKYPIVYDKTNDIVAGALDRDKVNEIIDQQIKLLKGEKDVED